jgi:hypothetical protein
MAKCIRCSTEFSGRTNKKYCSKTCGDNTRRDRWIASNPERVKELRKKQNQKQRLAIRDSHLRRTYGIGLEQFYDIMEEQDYSCKICSVYIEEFADKIKHRACVDHDHKTGSIRGVLCHSCNRGLGAFRDSPAIIRKAADYLQSTR